MWTDINKVVSAKLPDPAEPRPQDLFQCVKKYVLHGPLGELNRNCPRMVDDICSKNFPKDVCSPTRLG